MRLLPMVLALLSLSACGGEDSGSDELRPAVEAYSDAYLTGDGATAYGLLSAACQGKYPEAEFTALVDQAALMYGSALELKSYDAVVDGDAASVTYTYDVEAIS